MKIVKLESENVKRLRAVSIEPDGSLVILKGANGAGKTSVLDSIAYTLGGERLCPAEPIRRGAKKARAQVTLDNGLVIERRWTTGGSTLTVRGADGVALGSPQKVLDKLTGRLSFDPLAFMRMEPKAQAETLRKLAGVDFTAIDAKRASIYTQRTTTNAQVSVLKARLDATPAVEAPDEEVSLAALVAEHERLMGEQRAAEQAQEAVHLAEQQVARNVEAAQREVRGAEGAFERAGTEAQRCTDRAAELLEQYRKACAARDAALKAAEIAKGAIGEQMNRRADVTTAGEALVSSTRAKADATKVPDLGPVKQKMASVEATNAQVRAKKSRAVVAHDLAKAQGEARKLDDAIENIDMEKSATLAAAKLPIDGLGFTGSGVTMKGLPIEQASSAEQLRISLAMGLALNPELRVMLIRDGSLLDKDSLALVAQMAEAAGSQVWIEIVGTDGPAGIVIEDGSVVDSAAPAADTSPGQPSTPATSPAADTAAPGTLGRCQESALERVAPATPEMAAGTSTTGAAVAQTTIAEPASETAAAPPSAPAEAERATVPTPPHDPTPLPGPAAGVGTPLAEQPGPLADLIGRAATQAELDTLLLRIKKQSHMEREALKPVYLARKKALAGGAA